MGAYHLNEGDGQRLLQGVIPDGFFDAQGHGDPANPLSGRRHIFEHKTLASLLISVQGTGPTSPTPIMAGRA